MTTHTPGPWRLDDGYLKAGWNGVHLFKIKEMPGLHDAAEANARLIAAAPDLLAALTVIRDAFWSDGETAAEQVADLKEIARAAIAKAEGTQS